MFRDESGQNIHFEKIAGLQVEIREIYCLSALDHLPLLRIHLFLIEVTRDCLLQWKNAPWQVKHDMTFSTLATVGLEKFLNLFPLFIPLPMQF